MKCPPARSDAGVFESQKAAETQRLAEAERAAQAVQVADAVSNCAEAIKAVAELSQLALPSEQQGQVDGLKKTLEQQAAQAAAAKAATGASTVLSDVLGGKRPPGSAFRPALCMCGRESSVQVIQRAQTFFFIDAMTPIEQALEVERVLFARGRKHLGLLGMRERVAMVGGDFAVKSAPCRATTIRAEIPL